MPGAGFRVTTPRFLKLDGRPTPNVHVLPAYGRDGKQVGRLHRVPDTDLWNPVHRLAPDVDCEIGRPEGRSIKSGMRRLAAHTLQCDGGQG